MNQAGGEAVLNLGFSPLVPQRWPRSAGIPLAHPLRAFTEGVSTAYAMGCPLHPSARTRHSARAPRARRDDHAGPSLFGPVSSGLSSFADPLARDWIILIRRRREKLVARFSLRLLGQHRIGCIGQSLFQNLAWGLARPEVSGVIEV